MPLTDTAIRKAKPGATTIKLSDGGGLQLHVHPNGSKYWRLAYRYGGKQKKLSFGVYPEVSLAEARKRRSRPSRWCSSVEQSRPHARLTIAL